ncbi:hypothetical protein CHS0354_035292 [Potamilus streckersoni]|uniref:Uncharacterized protein n=1 Tax=Potamilus streckersoni TaxID=2493646 RepID=A0AAE0S2K5_9BIVA|nr:hypothetical protein CHS0354_035292 [Potamilus streckersoni]
MLHFRVDVTADRLYTLNNGTRNILENIKAPLTIKYFFSDGHKQIPAVLKNFGNNVREILQEYERVNPDMIKLEIINPKPDSDQEEWAKRYGIQGIEEFSPTEAFYMGIAVISETRETAITFMDPRKEKSLEYDISKAVFEVTKSDSFKIGIYTDVPITGGPENPYLQQQNAGPWVFYQELSKLYKTEKLNFSVKEIPADINLLVVLQPQNITESSEYAIDQFVMRGGKLVVLTDPYMASDPMTRSRVGNPSSGNLRMLFEKWGILYDAQKIVGDMTHAAVVRGQDGQPVPFGVWLQFNDEGINQDAQIMNGMGNLIFPYAGGFNLKADSPLKLTPLIYTSKRAQDIDAVMAGIMPPLEMNKQIETGLKEYNIAGMLTGKLSSAFQQPPPDIKTPSEQEQAQPTEPYVYKNAHIKEASAESSIILITDVDFMANHFSVSQMNLMGNTISQYRNNNLPLVFNLIDFISGSTDLIEIRSRGNFLRPFVKFEEMERQAQAKYNSAERELQNELNSVQRELNQLQPKEGSSEIVLSQDIAEQIKRFKEKELDTRRQLKEIRKLLRQDIEFYQKIFTGKANCGQGIFNDSFDTVTFTDSGNSFSVKKTDGIWVVAESEYPADSTLLYKLLENLNTQTITETASANPENFDKFGFTEAGKQSGKKITFYKDGNTFAEFLIGNSREGGGQYIKRTDTDQVWLIKNAVTTYKSRGNLLKKF